MSANFRVPLLLSSPLHFFFEPLWVLLWGLLWIPSVGFSEETPAGGPSNQKSLSAGTHALISDSVSQILNLHPEFDSLDAVISNLPSDYHENWTALFQSMSAQSDWVNQERPRLVLYSKKERTLLAFLACNPKQVSELIAPLENSFHTAAQTEAFSQAHSAPQEGIEKTLKACATLEQITLHPTTSQFHFREIIFSSEGMIDPRERGVSKNKNFEVRENPESCVQCHRSSANSAHRETQLPDLLVPLKPLWTPYNFWTGAIGGVSAQRNGEHLDLMTAESREHQAAKNLLTLILSSRNLSLHRLSKLSLREQDIIDSVLNEQTKTPDSIENQNRSFKSSILTPFSKSKSPNSELHLFLTELNQKSVLSRWLSQGSRAQVQVLGTWAKCFPALDTSLYNLNFWPSHPNPDAYFDWAGLQPLPTGLSYAQWVREIERPFRKEYRSELLRFSTLHEDLTYAALGETELLYYNQGVPSLTRTLSRLGPPFDFDELGLSFDLQNLNQANRSFGLIAFQNLVSSSIEERFPGLNESIACLDF